MLRTGPLLPQDLDARRQTLVFATSHRRSSRQKKRREPNPQLRGGGGTRSRLETAGRRSAGAEAAGVGVHRLCPARLLPPPWQPPETKQGTGRKQLDELENRPLAIAVLGVEGGPPSRGGRGRGVGTTTRLVPWSESQAASRQGPAGSRASAAFRGVAGTACQPHAERAPAVGLTGPVSLGMRSPSELEGNASDANPRCRVRAWRSSGRNRAGGARWSVVDRIEHPREEHALPLHRPQPEPGPTPSLRAPSTLDRPPPVRLMAQVVADLLLTRQRGFAPPPRVGQVFDLPLCPQGTSVRSHKFADHAASRRSLSTIRGRTLPPPAAWQVEDLPYGDGGNPSGAKPRFRAKEQVRNNLTICVMSSLEWDAWRRTSAEFQGSSAPVPGKGLGVRG